MQVLSETINNYETWQWLIMLIILIPASIEDLKHKKINVVIVSSGIISGIAITLILSAGDLSKVAFCLVPGLLMMLISYFTKESVGYGDGLVILAIGSIVGLRKSVEIMFLASLLGGAFSLILLIKKKASSKTAIPFVPFLLIGTLGVGIMG